MSTFGKRCPRCGASFISVSGEPASKANSRQIVSINGRLVPTRSKKHRALVKAWGAAPTFPLLDGDVGATFWLYYASRRPDLDESAVMDLLQGRVIRNDRQIKIKHSYWRLDRDNPRSVVYIFPLGKGSCRNCLPRRLAVREIRSEWTS